MISDVVARQRAYFDTGATLPLGVRLAALEKLQAAVKRNDALLCAALKEDLNKPPMEAYMTEIGIVLDELRYVIRHFPKWAGERAVPTPLSLFPARSVIVPEPYGVALILSPWNYPFQLCMTPLIGALAAGNCAVVKPSAYAPATSRAVAKLLAECFDPAYVAVIEGGREANSALLAEKFDYIFFTGSAEVGRLVMESAARHLTPVSLELGGKSPVIVDENADIGAAARRIVFGKLVNAGQTCVAPDYVLAQEDTVQKLLPALKREIEAALPGGDVGDFPVIVNEKHYARVKSLLDSGERYCGGECDDARRLICPAVLTNVSPDSPVMQQEIFGPILPVLTYRTLSDAIAFVNARPRPLALYLFTKNPAVERRVLSAIRFGGGCVNDTLMHVATHHLPFGGIGESGMGSYHGKKSFDTFTHYKSVLKAGKADNPLRYRPYAGKAERLVRMFLR